MNLIIDSNILISALIKDSLTRKIIIESDWRFYYPEMSFHEVRKYKTLVLEKSGIDEEEYGQILQLLLEHISLIPQEQFILRIQNAYSLIGSRDPDDVVFLALAMSIENSKLWTNDLDFRSQTAIQVLGTEQIVKLFRESL